MTHIPTITAAIIAQDEAANLQELLPRLDWVDEIVVLDGRSKDATEEVARSFGCRVEVRPFDTFAQQRNHALQMVGGDWVLSIDADERPTQDLVTEIRHKITQDRYAGFRIPIRSSIFGRPFRHSGTQDDLPVRLFRREAARWTGDVHEILKVSGGVGRLESWLEHRTLSSVEIFMTKMNRYTTLAAEARVSAGRSPRLSDALIAPVREVARRLVWKRGILDGPAGWRFCFLSGLSEWVLAKKHRRLWSQVHRM
jgi:glycosyltransferase involved in cell wall biosynthesis